MASEPTLSSLAMFASSVDQSGARDPGGCRNWPVEEEARRRENEGKKLVFVLNKIGACALFLVPCLCGHCF